MVIFGINFCGIFQKRFLFTGLKFHRKKCCFFKKNCSYLFCLKRTSFSTIGESVEQICVTEFFVLFFFNFKKQLIEIRIEFSKHSYNIKKSNLKNTLLAQIEKKPSAAIECLAKVLLPMISNSCLTLFKIIANPDYYLLIYL